MRRVESWLRGDGMSKGSKRRSIKQIDRDFKYVFPALKPKIINIPSKPWLTMTPEQIDQSYFHLGKADRTRMKREARQQIERFAIQETLRNDAQED